MINIHVGRDLISKSDLQYFIPDLVSFQILYRPTDDSGYKVGQVTATVALNLIHAGEVHCRDCKSLSWTKTSLGA